jgi:hypothetical protein
MELDGLEPATSWEGLFKRREQLLVHISSWRSEKDEGLGSGSR